MGVVQHDTVPVQVWADVDIGIADMVRYLNTIPGVRTLSSCQGTIGEGGPAPYRAQVCVTWDSDSTFERLNSEFDFSPPYDAEWEVNNRWGYVHPREDSRFETGRSDQVGNEGETAPDRKIQDTPIADWDRLEKFVRQHEEKQHVRYFGEMIERAVAIVEHYHSKAVQSMGHTELFQQELLVNLRALALVANSVADGHTHGEKNARLRGLISMIETAYHKISKWRIEVQSSLPIWSYEDVFRADYPAQHYLNRISDLEAALAKATGEPVKHSVFPQKESDPFSDEQEGGRIGRQS
jgi:hypothetical protein